MRRALIAVVPGTESSTTEPRALASPEEEAGSSTALLASGDAPGDALAPHAALEALRREAPPADALLANLMDEAMQAMLSHQAPAQPSRAGTPQQLAAPSAPADQASELEDFGAVLTAAEAAALAEQIHSDPPASFPERPEFGGHIITAMPTDEELAALFAESQPQPAPTAAAATDAGTPQRSDISAAALALERELSRDESPAVQKRDADEIQADLALEARGSVNLSEPPVRELEPLGPDGRPLEPEGALNRVPWWMAPLVWLNAPLATPSARDGAGKLALLILLNATAVLVYVYVIRR